MSRFAFAVVMFGFGLAFGEAAAWVRGGDFQPTIGRAVAFAAGPVILIAHSRWANRDKAGAS